MLLCKSAVMDHDDDDDDDDTRYQSMSFFIFSFVVDAADHDKIQAAYTELKNLLDKPQLANIPVLVLGNKNDLQNALTAEELIDALYVYQICVGSIKDSMMGGGVFQFLESRS